MRKRHRLRLLSLAVGTTASHQKKQLPRPLGQFLVPFAMLFGVALGVGQSTEEGQGLNPRSPRGTGLSSIMHTQRKALALTKWPRLEREPKVAVDPPLARIFFPRPPGSSTQCSDAVARYRRWSAGECPPASTRLLRAFRTCERR